MWLFCFQSFATVLCLWQCCLSRVLFVGSATVLQELCCCCGNVDEVVAVLELSLWNSSITALVIL